MDMIEVLCDLNVLSRAVSNQILIGLDFAMSKG